MVSTRQNVLIETHALRQQAAELLTWLEQSHQVVQAQLRTEQREDLVRLVAGRSALEQAIADTKRVIEALDRALGEARRGGDDSGSTLCGSVQVVGRIGAMFGMQAAAAAAR